MVLDYGNMTTSEQNNTPKRHSVNWMVDSVWEDDNLCVGHNDFGILKQLENF